MGEEHPQVYPDRFHHEKRQDKSLADMLARGDIDALYTARAPSTWASPNVKRLFDDPARAELDYFRKTGIFPAMHVVAIKRPLVENNPGLSKAIFDAFSKAQVIARAKLADASALSTMLPWQLEALLFAEEQLGKDYWPVGVAKNRSMLETIIRYLREDGLITTSFQPEDLFCSDMLQT
jgi:4,5-dihydroxyphthalate decarboxylase